MSKGKKIPHQRNDIPRRYCPIRQIGEGASGTVWLCKDSHRECDVALKLLRSEMSESEFISFRMEFDILTRLRHPHIVDVLDYGSTSSGRPYIAFTFIDTIPYEGFRKALTPASVREFLVQLSNALMYLHSQQIIHGDLKPANILISGELSDEFRLYVTDFGLARRLYGRGSGTAGGTFPYIAPESLTGSVKDPRSDLFALGVILYELITGELPFQTMQAYRDFMGSREYSLPVSVSGEWKDLLKVTERLLQPNPAARYLSARELLYHLDRESGTEQESRGYLVRPMCVGRNTLLESLITDAEAVQKHGFRSRIIEGLPGTGKTRLLKELEVQCQLQEYLCYSTEGCPAPLFTTVEGFVASAPASAVATVAAACKYIEKTIETTPLILLLDDSGQADRASREVMDELIRKKCPGLMVVQGMEADSGSGDILLNPLMKNEAMIMACSMFVPEPALEIGHRITDISGYFPGRIVKTVHYLVENNNIFFDRGKWRWNRDLALTIPDDDKTLAQLSINRLFPEEIEFLAALACVPEMDTPEVISEIMGVSLEMAAGMLTRFEKAGVMIFRQNRYRFADIILRDTAAAMIPSYEIRKFHYLAAEQFREAVGMEGPVSMHLLAAGDLEDALPEICRAAYLARKRGSLQGCLDLLKTGRAAVPESAPETPVIRKFNYEAPLEQGNTYMRLGDPVIAREYYMESLAAVDGETEAGYCSTVLGNLAQTFVMTNEMDTAMDYFHQAYAMAGKAGDNRREALLLTQMGNLAFRRNQFQDAANQYVKAIALLDKTDEKLLLGALYNNLGSCREMSGAIEEALTAYLLALPIKRKTEDKLGEAILLHNIGHLLGEQADLSGARRRLTQAREQVEALGETSYQAQVLASMAIVNMLQGRYRDAAADLDRAIGLARECKSQDLLLYVVSVRGRLLMETGNPDTAYHFMADRMAAGSELETLNMDTVYFYQRLALAACRAGKQDRTDPDTLLKKAEAADVQNPLMVTERRLIEAERLMASGALKAAIKVGVKVLKTSVDHRFRVRETRARLLLGTIYLMVGAPEKALTTLDEKALLHHIERNRVLPLMTAWLSLMSQIYSAMGNWEHAEKMARESGKLCDKLKKKLPDGAGPDHLEQYLTPIVQVLSEPTPESAAVTRNPEQNMEDRRKLMMLLDVTRSMGSERHLKTLLQLIVDKSLELTGAQRGFCYLRAAGADGEVLVCRHISRKEIFGKESRISTSVLEQVMETGKAVHLRDSLSDDEFKKQRSILAFNLRTIMCAPLPRVDLTGEGSGTEAAGVIYVDGTAAGPAFSQIDRDLFEALAAHAAGGIENIRLRNRLTRENVSLKQTVARQYGFGEIIGTSEPMLKLQRIIEKVAPSDAGILILGESGTGKELVARTIHFNGSRTSGPFLSINCAALTESILESELFGVESGVASGVSRRTGLFVQADTGTLFLDEIGDMPLTMQAKILRVLQERKVRPVGAKRSIDIDVRILCATNKDLWEEVEKDRFREDLLFRLDVITVHLPPLRDRVEDIPLLARHFLNVHASKSGVSMPEISPESMKALLAYFWPGNVRELENQMHRALILAEPGKPLILTDFSPRIQGKSTQTNTVNQAPYTGLDLNKSRPLKDVVTELEITLIQQALRDSRGNKRMAADFLGMSREGLRLKIDRLGIDVKKHKK